jgi:hypothetical protein
MIAVMAEIDSKNVIQASDEGLGHFSTFTQERGEAMMSIIKTWLEINIKYHPELHDQPVHVPDLGEYLPDEIINT